MTPRVSPKQQRAERQKHVRQGLHAGLGIVQASWQAAKFMQHKYGLIHIRDHEAHYTYQLGLQATPPHYPDEDEHDPPAIIRGHRKR